jgi:hypothetical protein
MKQATVSTAFMVGVHEQRPDISVRRVADCEGNHFSIRFDNPSPSGHLDRLTNLMIADRSGNQAVLAHRVPNALDCRDIG